jgi:hypothetical protein
MGLEHVRAPLAIIWAFSFQPNSEEKEQPTVGVAGRCSAPLKVRTEILPSEEAQARMAPSSWGAHDTELTGTTTSRVSGMVGVEGDGTNRTPCAASAP